MPSNARCPSTIGGGLPLPWADNMVRVPVFPGCIYFGFCPSSLVLTRAASASATHWASMAMHYTASLLSMQGDSDSKVNWDTNNGVQPRKGGLGTSLQMTW